MRFFFRMKPVLMYRRMFSPSTSARLNPWPERNNPSQIPPPNPVCHRLLDSPLETLFRIGCARSTVIRLQATELGIILVAGLALSVMAAGALSWYVVSSRILI